MDAQDLDSLLNNKRVYHTESIGNMPVPRIDGLLDDKIWELGEWQGNFIQQQPVGGAKGTERTYVKVLHDRSGLFVAIVCQDSEPDLIRDIFDRRDKLSGDMAGIAIDSYYDNKTAFEFNLSAAGQKMDVKHLGDYQWDFNWDAVWDGSTSKNDTGWVAEMKIPFSQLRYNHQIEHVWGMHVWRWISRKQEEDQWQFIPREAPAMVYLFGELKGVNNIRSSRQVEFLPHMLGASESHAESGSLKGVKVNGGLNAKVGISSDYTLDLSVNPDFGQVEADPSVLNLTSFETFYQEKRPLFLEGNEIFDFALAEDIPYYSRRIGSAPAFPGTYDKQKISDIPTYITILGAAKLTGKSSKGLSLGVVNGLTAPANATATDSAGVEKKIQTAPISNYLASRVKREFREGNSILGGMFSLVSRIDPDSAIRQLNPERALSGGFDLLHYWKNKTYFLEAKTIASQISGSPEAMMGRQLSHTHRFQRPDAGHLEVDSLREQLVGHGGLFRAGKKGGKINFSLSGQYRSPGLNLNDMGYLRQADFFGQAMEIAYKMNEPRNWIRNYTIELSQEALWSFGGENTMMEIGGTFTLMTNRLWKYRLYTSYEFTHLDTRELRGGPAIRIDPRQSLIIHFLSNTSKNFSASGKIYYMGLGKKRSHYKQAHFSLTWLPVRKIKVSGLASFDRRQYHQQYVGTLLPSIPNGNTDGGHYIVGAIDHRTASFTFRSEVFFTPELSIQYYGSPFYSVGAYEDFHRVARSRSKDRDTRVLKLNPEYDERERIYSYVYNSERLSFDDPDFSFIQFRSNLVLRWEYKLGSTLYLVWTHDRSGWDNIYSPVKDITSDLFGIRGNNVFMLKLNYWFSF